MLQGGGRQTRRAGAVQHRGRPRHAAGVAGGQRQVLARGGDGGGAVRVGQGAVARGRAVQKVHAVERGVLDVGRDLVGQRGVLLLVGGAALLVQALVGRGEHGRLRLRQEVGDGRAGGVGHVQRGDAAVQRGGHLVQRRVLRAQRLGDGVDRAVVLGVGDLQPGGDAVLRGGQRRVGGVERLQRDLRPDVGVDAVRHPALRSQSFGTRMQRRAPLRWEGTLTINGSLSVNRAGTPLRPGRRPPPRRRKRER